MRDRSIVPTNLLDWPAAAELLPAEQLLLIWLWASPYMSCAGAGLVPIKPAAATLKCEPETLMNRLRTLADIGLIMIDYSTGEIFIKDWFRFHTFKPTQKARNDLRSAINKVHSEAIKKVIYVKSIIYLPTVTSTSTSTPVSCTQETGVHTVRAKKTIVHGIFCWNDDDRQQVDDMVTNFGEAVVEAAASEFVEPLPSRVAKTLKGRLIEKYSGNSGGDYVRDFYGINIPDEFGGGAISGELETSA